MHFITRMKLRTLLLLVALCGLGLWVYLIMYPRKVSQSELTQLLQQSDGFWESAPSTKIPQAEFRILWRDERYRLKRIIPALEEGGLDTRLVELRYRLGKAQMALSEGNGSEAADKEFAVAAFDLKYLHRNTTMKEADYKSRTKLILEDRIKNKRLLRQPTDVLVEELAKLTAKPPMTAKEFKKYMDKWRPPRKNKSNTNAGTKNPPKQP